MKSCLCLTSVVGFDGLVGRSVAGNV